jgi:hypothetical protein
MKSQRPSVKLTTHVFLVLELRMSGALPPLARVISVDMLDFTVGLDMFLANRKLRLYKRG